MNLAEENEKLRARIERVRAEARFAQQKSVDWPAVSASLLLNITKNEGEKE